MDEQQPPYIHPLWEAAIHCFRSKYARVKGTEASLTDVQSFHERWLQNKSNRIRSEKNAECQPCKARYELCAETGESFFAPCPPEVRAFLRANGIMVARTRV